MPHARAVCDDISKTCGNFATMRAIAGWSGTRAHVSPARSTLRRFAPGDARIEQRYVDADIVAGRPRAGGTSCGDPEPAETRDVHHQLPRRRRCGTRDVHFVARLRIGAARLQ